MCRHWNTQLRSRTCVCQKNIWKADMVIWREARVGLWMELVAGHRLGLTPRRKPWRAGFPDLLLCTELTAARLSLSDPPGCAACHGNERGHCWSSWPNWVRALLLLQSLPERSAWKSPCRELREWGLGSYPIHSVCSYPIHAQLWCWWSSSSLGSSPLHCGSEVGWDGWRAGNSWGRASSSPLRFSVLVWSADTAAFGWAHSQKMQGFPDCNPALPLSASLCPIPHLWLGNSSGSASSSRCSTSALHVPGEVLIFIACKGEGGFSPLFREREFVFRFQNT